MDEPVTVRDVMNRSFVGVSEADSVAGAAALMRDEGLHCAVVLRGSDPVGVLEEDQLIAVLADGMDPAETTASQVMRPIATVDADQAIDHAIGAMTTDGIRHLLVEEDGELVGELSDHDVVTAHAVLRRQADLVEAQLAATAGGFGGFEADADHDVYSTQGVCENCGALTRELASHGGQLVCPDCLAM